MIIPVECFYIKEEKPDLEITEFQTQKPTKLKRGPKPGHRNAIRITEAKPKLENRFFCDLCPKGFSYKAGIKCHVITHTKRELKCKVCRKLFSDRLQLTNHVKSHKPFLAYHCNKCKKSYNDEKSYNYHQTRAHPGKLPYKCSACKKEQKGFVNIGKLKVHQLQFHLASSITHFKCDLCPYEVRNSKSLEKHYISK